jgi:nucleoid DNA-binding protein
MATAKKTIAAPAKKAVAAKKTAPAKKAVKASAPAKKAAAPVAPAAMKPIKTVFNKTSLITHLAEVAAVEVKAVKAIFASLEATILASVHKKGLGSFTLPGLLKVNVINVPAKKKRTGIDPFTKQERVFAAKPATVKIKTRALKKLKDAAA